jgi:hypothetical protein
MIIIVRVFYSVISSASLSNKSDSFISVHNASFDFQCKAKGGNNILIYFWNKGSIAPHVQIKRDNEYAFKGLSLGIKNGW